MATQFSTCRTQDCNQEAGWYYWTFSFPKSRETAAGGTRDDAGREPISELTGASVCDCSRGRHIEDLLGDCTLKYIQFA